VPKRGPSSPVVRLPPTRNAGCARSVAGADLPFQSNPPPDHWPTGHLFGPQLRGGPLFGPCSFESRKRLNGGGVPHYLDGCFGQTGPPRYSGSGHRTTLVHYWGGVTSPGNSSPPKWWERGEWEVGRVPGRNYQMTVLSGVSRILVLFFSNRGFGEQGFKLERASLRERAGKRGFRRKQKKTLRDGVVGPPESFV